VSGNDIFKSSHHLTCNDAVRTAAGLKMESKFSHYSGREITVTFYY